MNRRKPPKYRKQGNLIELPFSSPEMLGISEPDLSFAIIAVHVERKMRADPYFEEYPESILRAKAFSIAKKVEEYKKENPEKTIDQASTEIINAEKRIAQDESEACMEKAWEHISSSVAAERQAPKVGLNEIMAALGREVIEKYDIRKTWSIVVPSGKSKDEILDALKNGKYHIEESGWKIIIFPEFDEK